MSNDLTQKDLESRSTFIPGDNIVKVNSLEDINKVLPPFYMKLGQIKKFVKDLDKYSAAFLHLRLLFQSLRSLSGHSSERYGRIRYLRNYHK